jgi:hypothetical protein
VAPSANGGELSIVVAIAVLLLVVLVFKSL